MTDFNEEEDLYDYDAAETNEGWTKFINHFLEKHYPVFEKLGGISIAEAISIWKLNQIYNELLTIENILKKEDWQK